MSRICASLKRRFAVSLTFRNCEPFRKYFPLDSTSKMLTVYVISSKLPIRINPILRVGISLPTAELNGGLGEGL
jgi:hypothetical protein